MTTASQDRQFMNEMMPLDLLERAIDWIQKNLNPQDVFKDHDLRMWARNNGFKEEAP